MPDPRPPLKIKPIPGAFAVVFADGTQAVYTDGHGVARLETSVPYTSGGLAPEGRIF